MSSRIVEDRVLARIAYHAAGRSAAAGTAEGADLAFGHAMIALRVNGIAAGPETLRALRADIDGIVGDPERLAHARRMVVPFERPRPVNANAVPPRALLAAG